MPGLDNAPIDGAAVITMEMQRGICGDLATIDALATAVENTGVAARAGELVRAARSTGLPIVHCTYSLPADRSGLDLSLPLLQPARNDPGYLLEATAPTELLPELEASPTDIVCERHHGVSPFAGTSLDHTLRSLDVSTVILSGVSLNVGIIGTAIEAVNHGYDVVVAGDAVVGIPTEYGDAVLRNSIRAIATVAAVSEIVEQLRSNHD